MSHIVVTDITGREWVGDSDNFTPDERRQMDTLFSEGIRNLNSLAIAIGGNYHYFNTDNVVSVAFVADDKEQENAS